MRRITRMSSANFENLIHKYPQDRETIQRLERIISEPFESSKVKCFSLKRLYELTSPPTDLLLAQLLNYLVVVGAMKKIVRVESPSLGGIADFSSLTEVPERIHDWRRDIEVEVNPEDIHILYQVIPDSKKSLESSGPK